jgi:hypothetical protein
VEEVPAKEDKGEDLNITVVALVFSKAALMSGEGPVVAVTGSGVAAARVAEADANASRAVRKVSSQ